MGSAVAELQMDLLETPDPAVMMHLQEIAKSRKKKRRKRQEPSLYGLAMLRMFIGDQTSFDFGDEYDADETQEAITWSFGDIIRMHCVMLRRNLHFLKDTRTTPETREALLGWVIEPLTSSEEAVKKPFCFQACCIAYGIRADRMQVSLLKTLGLSEYIDESQGCLLTEAEDYVESFNFSI